MCAINDPLNQTHSPAISDHYSHLKVVLFCEILKKKDECTDTKCENSDVITTASDCGSVSWINYVCIVNVILVDGHWRT